MSAILALFVTFLTHEGGHFLAALLLTGKPLKFRFALGKFCIPRFIWNMPNTTRQKQRIIALAGFATEFMVVIALSALVRNAVFISTAIVHLAAYRFYAGEASDFRWL